VSAITKPAPTQWVTAAPLWPTATADPAVMQSPALLRFQSDTFMNDLIELLQNSPQQLANQVAQPESYRVRPVGADATWRPAPQGAPLKLFQPVHGYFYLVAASLVCRLAGLPDHTVNVGRGEKVLFVLRQYDINTKAESAWVTLSDGKTKAWQPVSSTQAVADGEDLLPLFPVRFPDGDLTRSLFVGLVPTSSRETYQAAPTVPQDAAGQHDDVRKDEFEARVLSPLTSFQYSVTQGAPSLVKQGDASMFLLLDFADFLMNQQVNVLGPTPPDPSDPASDLYQFLQNATAAGSTSWLQALNDAWSQRHVINGEQPGDTNPAYDLLNANLATFDLNALKTKVESALGDYKPPQTPPELTPLPKLDPAGGTYYVLRCVYRRPSCLPPRGKVVARPGDVVSPPSAPFLLAPYFDADAPSRPIRIPLPQDTSIAGLRKFAKKVAFITNGTLRQQVASVTNLKNLINGKASGDPPPPNLGEICSFSLPIITICAMIVLIIFVILLNLAFWWMPFFRLCFPIPEKE
jgi:hypothetical protein